VSRATLAIVLALALFFAVAAVQWFVTSPGGVTYGEFRLMLLAAVPAATVVLSAYWVSDGRTNREDWRR
jgi:hypothetical protein